MIRGWRNKRAARRLEGAGADPRLVAYLERGFGLDKRQRLEDVRFVVLDCETTGLNPEQDRLLSIAAVGVQGRAVHLGDRLELTVEGQSVGGHAAAPVHGLVTRDLVGGLTEADALGALLGYLGDAVLVAHHAAFDLAVLNRALARLDAPGLQNPVIDTGHLARRLDKGPVMDDPKPGDGLSLDALALRFGFDIPNRHSASGDALVTAYVLLALLARADRRGIRSLGDLLAR